MLQNEIFEKTLQDFSLRTISNLYVSGKNLIYSPASLTYAMGMLLEGTSGTSRQEIMQALFDPKFDGTSEVIEKASNYLVNLTANANPQGIQQLLSVANFFYTHKDFRMHPVFVGAIERKYNAQGKELDFIGNNIGALNSINSDVDKATRGLIPHLLDQIHPNTKSVLVNAIYFKGLWKSPFKKELTENKDFTLSNGNVIKVPMMNRKITAPYYQDSNRTFSMIKLPYSCEATEERVYMVCVLPKKVSIKDYLNHFNPRDFSEALDNCYRKDDIRLQLPRFKISSTHSLTPTLKSLGVKHVFSDGADLSKMSLNPEDRLNVSEIFQKAVIEVNEEGTEAAAATAIIMRMCMLKDETTFEANRPFLYAIITENKERQKHIIFIGIVENPLEG